MDSEIDDVEFEDNIPLGNGIEAQIKGVKNYTTLTNTTILDMLKDVQVNASDYSLKLNTQISKNCYLGLRVQSLQEINVAALYGRSLYHTLWKIKPAKVLMMMQAQSLQNAINGGILYYVINLNPKKK